MSVNADDLGKLIVARTGPGELVALGKMIGYVKHPVAIIRTHNGNEVHWVADLCSVLKIAEDEQEMVERIWSGE